MMRSGIHRGMLASAMVIGLAAGAPARAEDPQHLGDFGDWAAYAYDSPKGKVCYVIAQPKATEPAGVKRDQPYFLVTHRLGQSVRNEVSTIIGYPFKKDATVTVTIGTENFEMFTSGDGGWFDSNAKDRQVVLAMKKGSDMLVKGTSARGTATADKYSLAGISAALDKIDGTCK